MSTPSATRERSNTSDPEICFRGCLSLSFLVSLFVSNASIRSCFYLFSILQQNPTSHTQPRLFPCSSSFGDGCIIYQQRDCMFLNVYFYNIIVFYECDQSTFKCFRCNMPDHESVRAA